MFSLFVILFPSGFWGADFYFKFTQKHNVLQAKQQIKRLQLDVDKLVKKMLKDKTFCCSYV